MKQFILTVFASLALSCSTNLTEKSKMKDANLLEGNWQSDDQTLIMEISNNRLKFNNLESEDKVVYFKVVNDSIVWFDTLIDKRISKDYLLITKIQKDTLILKFRTKGVYKDKYFIRI